MEPGLILLRNNSVKDRKNKSISSTITAIAIAESDCKGFLIGDLLEVKRAFSICNIDELCTLNSIVWAMFCNHGYIEPARARTPIL